METLYIIISVICSLFCAMRILCFDARPHQCKKGLEIIASCLIATLICHSINIIFFKDPVTIFDAIFSVFMAVIVHRANGNLSKVFGVKS